MYVHQTAYRSVTTDRTIQSGIYVILPRVTTDVYIKTGGIARATCAGLVIHDVA